MTDSSFFVAELDGGAPQNLTTKAIFKQEDVQQVIYQADGLDEAKEHTLVSKLVKSISGGRY